MSLPYTAGACYRTLAWQPVHNTWNRHQHIHFVMLLALVSLVLLRVLGQCRLISPTGCKSLSVLPDWCGVWTHIQFLNLPYCLELCQWLLSFQAVMAFPLHEWGPKVLNHYKGSEGPNHYKANCFKNLSLNVQILAQILNIYMYIPECVNYYFST